MGNENERLEEIFDIEELGEINLAYPALLDKFDESLTGVHVPDVLMACAEKIDELIKLVNRLKKEIENNKK